MIYIDGWDGFVLVSWLNPVKRVPCEVYSRVVGYFRPVQNWNLGKRAEFGDRVPYNADKSLEHPERVAS